MLQKIRLNGGLSAVAPETDIQDNCASALTNLQVGVDGRLIECPAQTPVSLPTHSMYSFEKIWIWEPSTIPADCVDTHVYIIAQIDKTIRLLYRKTSPSWQSTPLGSVSSITNLMVDSSPEMFVFVTGRNGERAKKITIDANGTPSMSNLGATQSITPPIVRKITCDPTKDEQFTGMPIGSTLMYCYCIVNKWGEKSNPSPVAVVDTAQWMAKKEGESENSGWTQKNTGSIKSVEVECRIPERQNAVSIQLYRTSAQYVESGTPVPLMQLVAIRDIGDGEKDVITVSDVNFPAEITADYENDPAPAADDIAIADNKIFLANASNLGSFLYPATTTFKITIQNNNPIEYVNRWYRLALLDSTAPAEVRLTNERIEITPNTRIIDNDRTTCLLSYYNPGGTIKDPGSGVTCNTVHELWVRIPIVPMNSSKDIYLVTFTTNPGSYGEPPISGSLGEMLEYEDHVLRNPVRDEWAMLCMGKNFEVEIVGSPIGDMINKANTANQHAQAKPEFTEITADGIAGSTAPANAGARVSNANGVLVNAFFSTQAKPDGFIFGTAIKTTLPAGARVNIAELLGYILWLKSINGLPYPCLWIADPADSIQHFIPLPSLDIDDVRMYISISTDELTNALNEPYARVNVFYKQVGGEVLHNAHDVEIPRMGGETYNHVDYAPASSNPVDLSFAYQYYASKGYRLNRYNASQMMHHLPLFPVQPIGLCGYTTIPQTGTNWITSQNVTITKGNTPSQAGTSPVGLIRWGSGGAFPQLNEYPTQHNILKIAPLKSFASTDEHNTMMIWTSDGKLMRLALLGETAAQAQLIIEIEGLGRINRSTLCRTPYGFAWGTASDIFLLTENGIKNLSDGRVSISTLASMFYLRHRKKIAVNISSSSLLMYSPVTDTWHRETTDYSPAETGGSMQNNDFYVNKASKKITSWLAGTRGSQTVSTKRLNIPTRISRIRINGTSAGSSIAITFHLFGSRYVNSGTPTMTIPLNTFVALPGIGYASKGIKIVLLQTSTISSIEDIDLEISDEN